MLTIRPFTAADYPAFTRITHDALGGGLPPFSEAVYRQRDANRPAGRRLARFMAVEGADAVGFCEAQESPRHHAPGRWLIHVAVVADARGRGVGRALTAHLEGWLRAADATSLRAYVNEDSLGAAFAARRGFRVEMREAFARLDLATFDSARFPDGSARLAAEGLTLSDAAHLLATDPDAKRRWWGIDWAIERDIPSPDPPTQLPFETFQRYFEAPWFDPAAWFVVRDGAEWVGITGLKATASPALWQTAVTGVVRSHRRRGIATALKLRAIDFARSQGGRWIRTENEERNPMLSINLRLGFAPYGARLEVGRQMGAGSAADE